MSSPFPLLRLPGVILCEVFKSLSIEEKIKLSLCSTKISTQINNAQFYSHNVIVNQDFLSHKIRIHSENNKDVFEILICPDIGKNHNSNTQRCPIACCTVPVIFIPTGIKIFWKIYSEGFLSVIQHLLKVFQCKISININCYCSNLFQQTISKLFDLQLEFRTLTIKTQHLTIYNNLGRVEDLRIFSLPDPEFIPVFTSWPQKITIMNSAWFTLEYLLTCTCTRIFLEDSSLGNEDLDVVLKNWKSGGFPNLEYLYIESQRISDNGSTILGVNLLKLRGKHIKNNDRSKKLVAKLSTKFGFERIEMSVTVV
ncbi:hypothetical protein CRE_22018 [Caenorhabditis remanei]|uniref:F-box domain-containing protein n=1 Tax=Caenorhabditis remanei TaxID=31234 RepID=E3N3E9_CAERE|nr:hypothetical protein CRE_22018 [Caenorhabditis remanei]